ncbi:MAG: hypothetical protein WB810_02250 [Candidatus Cybelea sp.]
MSALVGETSGWIALALIPVAAGVGWFTRRWLRGQSRHRMRPHYVVGYATLGFALLHGAFSMGAMTGADATGIRFATVAIFGLGWQALLGSNLQSPGDYRKPLRRWHLVTFVAVAIFAAGHVLLDR